MALQSEEQDALIEMVEQQSNVIREMAITQNALIRILLDKGYITNLELDLVCKDVAAAMTAAE